MKHHRSVESGMGMADGHGEWDRAAYVRGGVGNERGCCRKLLSEKAVGVERDDAG